MKLLVPTSGSAPARHTVEYVVRIACNLKTDTVVLHVYSDSHPQSNVRETFDIFVEAVATVVSVFRRESKAAQSQKLLYRWQRTVSTHE